MAALHVNMCAAKTIFIGNIHGRMLGSSSGGLIQKLGASLVNSQRSLTSGVCVDATRLRLLTVTCTGTLPRTVGLSRKYPELLSPPFRTYYYTTGHLLGRLKSRYIGVVNPSYRLYSLPPKANRNVSITEDILKSKVASSVPSEQDKQNVTGSGNEAGQTPSNIGDASKKDSSKDSKRKSWWFRTENAWKVGLISLTGLGALLCANALMIWGVPPRDEDGSLMEDEFSHLPKWQAYPRRAWLQMHFFTKMIQEPSSLKLLPDPLKDPYYQPPYTLVLEMTGVLVHPDWTIGTGWRFKKRPGVDYFLQQISSPLYEIVIYTHEQGFTAFPIIDGLDPNGHVMYRLFRDATNYTNGCHVKDLACLNRDLSKVIIVDCDQKAFSLQPQNAFLLSKWTGDDSDRTLIDLAAFLRMIALSDVDDVRPVLEYYSQFDDPIAAFKEKQRLLQEQQDQARAASVNVQTSKGLVGGWSFGLTGRK